MSNKAQAVARSTGFLTRLRKDQRGNTLMMVGAAIFPMIAFIGSGMDMSRAYLVKTRMQQACDAGALAGRKAMAGTTLSASDKTTAENFFRFNFPNGTMATAPLTVATDGVEGPNKITIGLDSSNQVGMTATAVMPNMLMQVFGYDTQTIRVSCKAEEYYVNTDVMLVLDTTGSMNCTISDATSCGQPTEKSGSKMEDLRAAVKTLYTNLRPAQLALEAKSLRMRIGWVPYSSTVNTGRLVYAIDPTAIKNPSTYYNATPTSYTGGTRPASWFTGTGSSDWNGCIVERDTVDTITSTSTSIPSGAYDLDIATMPTTAATRWAAHDPEKMLNFDWWIKEDTSTTPPTMLAKTSSDSGYYKPANYSDALLKKYGYSSCAHPAVKMQVWASQAAFDTEINKIVTGNGGTYHDIGMIWGTRMIANTGIFGAGNPDTFNSVKVRRTIVLVTDGLMSPNNRVYGAYSQEKDANRTYADAESVGSTWSGSAWVPNSQSIEYKARHEKRFNLMCDRAKAMNIDIWVVAILDAATPISTSLQNCASNSAQAVKASNTTALNNAFKAVSDKVGNLRIGS
jgi:Flp pilus assembly protein TadG